VTVIWQPPALDQLADYYVLLPLADQRALEVTVKRIDKRLEENAWSLGESRGSDARRLWFTGPFAVSFDIQPGGLVYVLHIGILKRPRDEP
jgi:hypothetical protein